MAIYIVKPTEENFKLIKTDLEKRIFDNYYINFTERIDDSILQSFFSDLVQTDNYSRIYKICVNPIGFLLYHPSVFSLNNIKSPYALLNSPKTQESEINSYFNKVGDGIYNSLFTMKTLPVIKYRTGWFAEEIINVIQSNFKQTFDKFPELMEEFPRKNNTLMVILDRDTDLPIMLHHSASLGAMLNDVFGIARSKCKDRFEIDPLTDYIWNSCLSMSFVLAKEKVIEELKKLNEQTDYLNDRGNSSNGDGDLEKISEKLSTTLEGLRDINIKQNVLNNHAKFLDKLSGEVDDRRLGNFYELEEASLNKRNFTRELKQKFFDIITLKSINIKDIAVTKSDILRLCLMYYLINNKITQDEINEIEKALLNIQQSKDALDYLKQKRSFEESMKKGNSSSSSQSGFLQNSVSFFVNKVGSLMNTEQPSITADILTSLSNNKEVTNFVTCHSLKKGFDKDKLNQTFSQVIVFMVGGGSLSEYEYVDEVLKKNNKSVW